MSHVFIITGMYRSGTSLTTSLLQRGGINIGERLHAPGRWNPRGFFEDADFCEFHDRALLNRGMASHATKEVVFKPTAVESEKAIAMVKQREGMPLWGWKDPRTCLFLEFWHHLLPGAFFLFVYRHPLEVLLSLMRV